MLTVKHLSEHLAQCVFFLSSKYISYMQARVWAGNKRPMCVALARRFPQPIAQRLALPFCCSGEHRSLLRTSVVALRSLLLPRFRVAFFFLILRVDALVLFVFGAALASLLGRSSRRVGDAGFRAVGLETEQLERQRRQRRKPWSIATRFRRCAVVSAARNWASSGCSFPQRVTRP